MESIYIFITLVLNWAQRTRTTAIDSHTEYVHSCVSGDVPCWDAYIDYISNDTTASWLKSTMCCESRYDQGAISPSGTYIGAMQFDHPTFSGSCNGSIYNMYDQVNCSKILYERGEVGRWPNCGYLYYVCE